MVATDLKPEQVPVTQLVGAEYNPRDITAETMEALKASLRDFGFVQPVIARRSDNTIIGGHQRVSAMMQIATEAGTALDDTLVPVVFVDLDDERTKLLNLALNKISGDWDFDKLASMLSGLGDLPEHLRTATGFTDAEIADLTSFDLPAPPPSQTATRAAASQDPNEEPYERTFSFEVESAEQAQVVRAALTAAGMMGPRTGPAAFVTVCRDAIGD